MFGANRQFLMDGLKETLEAIGQNESVKAVGGAFGPVATVAGSLMQYGGARNAGKQARAAAEFEAAQLDQNAGQAKAASQRTAHDERRRGRLVASRAQAVAAMSGGGADPTVVNLISDIDAEAMYRSNLALYAGDDRARAMHMAAAGRRYTGAATEKAYRSAGRQALFRGASLFSKYSGTPPVGMRGLSDDDWGMEY